MRGTVMGVMLKEHLKSMVFLGTLCVSGDKLSYRKPKEYSRAEINNFGDIVYFIVIDNQLMKIGKAGGISGWLGRVAAYCSGIASYGDKTNQRIFRVLKEKNKLNRIMKVYGIVVPRKKITFTCPLTCDIITEYISLNGNVEKILAAKYMKQGYKLPFCNQF
jgi:hypothetical protein